MPEQTRLVRVDLTGSPLHPGWRRVAVEVELPHDQNELQLAAAAASFYQVPVDHVRVEAIGPPLARYTCVEHNWFSPDTACPHCKTLATIDREAMRDRAGDMEEPYPVDRPVDSTDYLPAR